MRKNDIQLLVAVITLISGLALLFTGLWIPPVGIIDNSVLIAFGEVATFSGSLLGVDYTYKYKLRKIKQNEKDQ